MTITRRELRDRIAFRYGNKFHELMGGASALSGAGADLDTVIDDALTQSDDAWNSRWFHIPREDGDTAPKGDVRRVQDFTEFDDTLHLDRPLSASPSAQTEYQLFDIFSPHAIHGAINAAISEAGRVFFGLRVDQDTFVITEKTLEYSLSGLTPAPWKIHKVWVERPNTVVRGLATAAGATTLSDTLNSPFGSVQAGWKVSIYGGTGAGQVRTVSSKTSSQLTVPAWTTTPDTTSKYAVWDPNEQLVDWFQLIALRFDNVENPTKMYLHNRYESFAGMRVRIQYSYEPGDLDYDDEATPVPFEFVVPWALKELYQSRMDGTRVDRGHIASQVERYRIEAETYRATHAPSEPSGTIWVNDDPRYAGGPGFGNPLGWNF